MVKNTKGGKGHKSLGRKFQNQSQQSLRKSNDPLEKYAFISKMFGNGMCEVNYIDEDDNMHTILGHIRNKMRGRQKRHNIISPNSIVLVGLREWESTPKNCDIICIYDPHQVEQLKQFPDINIDELLKLDPTTRVKNEQSDDFIFSNEDDTNEESEEVIQGLKYENFDIDNDNTINIDDI